MRFISRHCALRAALISVVTLVALDGSANAAEIILGQSVDMTGPVSGQMADFNAGMQMYFDQTNAAGGVRGQKIKVLTLDDVYKADKTAENTKTLIANPEVLGLIGYRGTPNAEAAEKLASEARIALIAPVTGAQSIRTSKVVFPVRAAYSDEVSGIMKFYGSSGFDKKIAVFYRDDSYGKPLLEQVKAALPAYPGMIIVDSAPYTKEPVDTSAIVRKFKASGASSIFMFCTPLACEDFIKNSHDAGATWTMFQISSIDPISEYKKMGVQASGVATSEVTPYPQGTSAEIASEYRRGASKANHGADYKGLEGYIAAKYAVTALQTIRGPITRESFIAALQQTKNSDLGDYSAAAPQVELVTLDSAGHFVH